MSRFEKERNAWRAMQSRCYDTNSRAFWIYGALQITVCDRWRAAFENFLADMGPAPSPSHSVDRINPWGSYEPKNCRWATPLQQRKNKRRGLRELRDSCRGLGSIGALPWTLTCERVR